MIFVNYTDPTHKKKKIYLNEWSESGFDKQDGYYQI